MKKSILPEIGDFGVKDGLRLYQNCPLKNYKILLIKAYYSCFTTENSREDLLNCVK